MTETIIIDYSKMACLPTVQDTAEYDFNSKPIVSPSIKIKNSNIFHSVRFTKSKLIKKYEHSKHNIRELKF